MKCMRALLVSALLTLIASPALAHTALVSATPPIGSSINSSPTEIRLEFTEELILVGDANPNKIEVFDESGLVVSGETKVSGPMASVDISPVAGVLTVRYHVVSSDGHPVEGEYKIIIDNQRVDAASEIPESEDGPNLLIRLVWTLLVLSAIGTFALLRLRK